MREKSITIAGEKNVAVEGNLSNPWWREPSVRDTRAISSTSRRIEDSPDSMTFRDTDSAGTCGATRRGEPPSACTPSGVSLSNVIPSFVLLGMELRIMMMNLDFELILILVGNDEMTARRFSKRRFRGPTPKKDKQRIDSVPRKGPKREDE